MAKQKEANDSDIVFMCSRCIRQFTERDDLGQDNYCQDESCEAADGTSSMPLDFDSERMVCCGCCECFMHDSEPDPDAVCTVCGETWLDQNGLEHASASSDHEFTTEPILDGCPDDGSCRPCPNHVTSEPCCLTRCEPCSDEECR